jgi:hypothetical protein
MINDFFVFVNQQVVLLSNSKESNLMKRFIFLNPSMTLMVKKTYV